MHTIFEYGLIECLLKTLSVIASIYPTSENHVDLNTQEILIDDINSLIITLITSAIHTPGVQNIQVSFYIVCLFKFFMNISSLVINYYMLFVKLKFYFQILNDSVYQCRYLQKVEIQTSKVGHRSNLTLRETQRFILESGMDTIQDLIQTQPPLIPALSRLKKNLSSGI